MRAWDIGVASYVRWNRVRGYTPAEFLDWFAWLVETRPPYLARAMQKPAKASVWDSHPSTEERIAMIAREPQPAVPADERPGIVLVADREPIGEALRTAGFQEWVTRLAQDEAQSDAKRLHRARVGLFGGSGDRFGDVLDLLAAGRRGELSRALRAPTGPLADADWIDSLAGLVYAATAAAVVACGAAQWHHAWSQPLTLIGADGPVDLRPAVDLACHDVVGVAPLRALLLDLGVEEASLVEWAVPGQSALNPGTVMPQPLPGSDPSIGGGLLLPDMVLLLIRSTPPRRRPDHDVVRATLAAAAVAELRRRGRVRIDDTPDATIMICDPASTGDAFLDGVLTRLTDGRPRPAYRWLQALGPDVEHAVSSRIHAPLRYQDGRFVRMNNLIPVADLIQQARSAIVTAVDHNDVDSVGLLLGKLLWALELTPTVLGRLSPVTRYWLGHLARRDRLAMAIRTVVGVYILIPGRSG